MTLVWMCCEITFLKIKTHPVLLSFTLNINKFVV
jgi:hypothetical protein